MPTVLYWRMLAQKRRQQATLAQSNKYSSLKKSSWSRQCLPSGKTRLACNESPIPKCWHFAALHGKTRQTLNWIHNGTHCHCHRNTRKTCIVAWLDEASWSTFSLFSDLLPDSMYCMSVAYHKQEWLWLLTSWSSASVSIASMLCAAGDTCKK